MRIAFLPLLLATVGLAASQLVGAQVYEDGPKGGREERARQSWMLQCQGCHRPEGGATEPGTPALAGHVATFLNVEGGREYLARVPGVATANLNDEKLAELLNWTLRHFDGGKIPADFRPYTAEEIGRLRRQPLRTEAKAVRADLLARYAAGRAGTSR